MVFIKKEGKINDNTYLVDGMLFRWPGNLALYVIESSNGMRMMIDASEELAAKKIVNKLKELNIYPIQKILLSHSHWDHVQGVAKLKKLMGDIEVEVLASEKAISNLKNPDKLNKCFGYKVNSIEDVTPLKEGDTIDLNGLKLEVINLFGHTQDSIGIIDKKNKNIFTADAIIHRYDYETVTPTFFHPDFNETELLKSFQKLRKIKNQLNSICLTHYGMWTDKDFDKIINEMESHHYEAKKSIIQWYQENPSIDYIASKYHEKFMPNSKIHTKSNMQGLVLLINWLVGGLKYSGFIK